MNYLFKRVLAVIPVLAIVAVIVFLLLRLAPGDPAVIIAGDTASAQDIEQVRHTLGLDRPLLEQFVVWIGHIVRGDFGTSVFTGMPVAEMILQRVEPTLWIAALTMLFAVVFAVPMGILAAWKAGTWVDRAVSGLAVAAFSLPVFVIVRAWTWSRMPSKRSQPKVVSPSEALVAVRDSPMTDRFSDPVAP